MFRVLEALRWEVPDWIVVPGGNLGNSSAFGKAFMELKELGLIDRLPRLAVINAAGADTLFELFEHRGLRWDGGRANMVVAGCPFIAQQSRGNRYLPYRRLPLLPQEQLEETGKNRPSSYFSL